MGWPEPVMQTTSHNRPQGKSEADCETPTLNEVGAVCRSAKDQSQLLQPSERRFMMGPVFRTIVSGSLILGGALLLAACSSGGPATTASTSTSATPHSGVSSSTTVIIAPDAATPGDIPDTIAYLPYSNVGGGYTFVRPEGWAQTEQGTSVTFTSTYNGIHADVAAGTSPPTAASAQTTDIPALTSSQSAFQLVNIAPVTLPGGSGVLITYKRNSSPDPVTNKSVRQIVQRYEIAGAHHVVVLELSGAVGADNVDPYTKISHSLRIS